MDVDTKLENARCRALISDPWYGVIAARFDWAKRDNQFTENSAMSISLRRLGRVTCFWSEEKINELTLENTIALFKHNIEHIIRMHVARLKNIVNGDHSRMVWNLATDWVINGPRNNMRIKDLPDSEYFIPSRENPGPWSEKDILSIDQNATAEEFADWIIKHTETKEVLDPQTGIVWSVLVVKSTGKEIDYDPHSCWDSSEATENEMRSIAKELAGVGAAAGKAPGNLVDHIEALYQNKIKWTTILKSIIGRCAGGKRQTFARRNRKRDSFGIKGSSKHNRIKLNVLVDTSGSVSRKMLEQFFSEIEAASKSFKIRMIEFDAQVNHVSDYHKGDWKNIKIHGRGGTNFEAALTYMEEEGIVGRMNIIFTDGYDSLPPERDYPVLWVIVGEGGREYLESQGKLWGEVIVIDQDPGKDPW